MLNSFRTRKSNVFVWILMAGLIVGLAGIGIGVGGGLTSREVATVGKTGIEVDEFARAFEQETRAVSQQIGRTLSTEEARSFGLERMALSRLVDNAAIHNEAVRLGLSTGDAVVAEEIMRVPAFQNAAGEFDESAYKFFLERSGQSATDFERQLRRDATRTLLVSAIASPSRMPDIAAQTVLDYMGEQRSFDWLRLEADQLTEQPGAPTDSDLESWHADNAGAYTSPEIRRITYAAITPDQLSGSIEIAEEELRAIFEDGKEEFGAPERRIIDRIAFGTAEEAADALSRIGSGETDFDAVAAERGLNAADITVGTLSRPELDAASAEAVFAGDGPGIAGPVETPLGPALFRINAILAAQEVSFEDMRDELRSAVAAEEAQRLINSEISALEDLIAGGATIEEIAADTLLEEGTIALSSDSEEELASDPAFRELADNAREGEETDLAELISGGLVTLRVEATEEPALIPLDDIRNRVEADWREAETARLLTETAEALVQDLGTGTGFSDAAEALGVTPENAGPLKRGEVLPGTPPRLIADIFAAEEEGTVVIEDGATVIVARLGQIVARDPEADADNPLAETLRQQYDAQFASDIVALYTGALRGQAGVKVNQSLIESALTEMQ